MSDGNIVVRSRSASSDGSSIFRGRVEPAGPDQFPAGPTSRSLSYSTKAVAPYSSYEQSHGRNFFADYFGLGDTWKETEGGFSQEVATLEKYFDHLIQTAEIPDSVTAVEAELKKMARLTDMTKEERAVVKVGTLAGYAEFLLKTEGIKADLSKHRSHNGGKNF